MTFEADLLEDSASELRGEIHSESAIREEIARALDSFIRLALPGNVVRELFGTLNR